MQIFLVLLYQQLYNKPMFEYIYKILTSENPNLFFTKILLFLGIILAFMIIYKITEPPKLPNEGFTQKETFVLKTNDEVYDDFYADIYDQLYETKQRCQKELVQILKTTEPTTLHSTFLDIGSGTGYVVDQLRQGGYMAYGLDKSQAMVNHSEQKYPESEYKCGDAKDPMTFESGTFTHILCTNFTIYLIQDKATFFKNCYFWLKPNGYLVLHLVNRNKFSIYKPNGKKSPFDMSDYLKRPNVRITDTMAEFEDYNYTAKLEFPQNKYDTETHKVILKEKLVDMETKHVRENEHTLYLDALNNIIKMASQAGFIVKGKITMSKLLKTGPNADKFQHLYIFERMM
jgi:SAM-dependent methyltransferase